MSTAKTLQQMIAAATQALAPVNAPKTAIVLGSGLGGFAESLENPSVVPYSEIPFMPTNSVAGHAGQFVLGKLEGRHIIVMQGRAHLYEGFSPNDVVFGIRVMHALGAKRLVVTNAAGGLNPNFKTGDIMLVDDQINLTGESPLIGPEAKSLGERFVDMSQTYDLNLRQLAVECAKDEGIQIQQGVYVGLKGPAYETPAEIKMLRMLGADAVGMSTVLEVIAARQVGMPTLGFSCITNDTSEIGTTKLSHEDVQEQANETGPRLAKLLKRLLRSLPEG